MMTGIAPIGSMGLIGDIQYMGQGGSKRLILLLTASLFFLVGFILNITSDTALYNVDLNIVPTMQDNSSLGSSAFLDFMNVISNIFNPVICVAYVAIFWLISSRKLEIMVFLVWFIALSWLLTILKVAIHQSRPYWNPTAGVKMLEWTCYSEFGCPSGHSMLGLILIEFVIRFFMREYDGARRMAWLLYAVLVVLELLVMFSRVILGMHTFNQVLMGAMIGMYSVAVYYLYAEAAIIGYFRSLLDQAKKKQHIFLLVLVMLCCFLLEILLTYLPNYNYQSTYQFITTTYSRCNDVKYYKSFQYKCFEDSALLMAGIGLIVGFMFMDNPENLTKPLAYTRLSWKFVGRLVLMIVLAAIPAALFLNPLWTDISGQNASKAVIIWITQSIGFFLAIIMLLLVAPILCGKAGFEQFKSSEYLEKVRRESKGELEMSRSSCV